MASNATLSSSPGTPASLAAAAATTAAVNEDDLRGQVLAALENLNRREPLDTTYKRLLMSSPLTRRSPTLPKDAFYKRIRARLRERVEVYMTEMQGKDPFDRISQRKPLEEAAMKAAFTLREAKEHEQTQLLEDTIAAQAMDPERKRHLDGIAKGLQMKREKKLKTTSNSLLPKTMMEQTEHARQRAELDRQRAQARKWEDARRHREEEERRKKEQELNRRKHQQAPETPQQKIHKLIEPVFRKLWDMEFANLGGTNPFRIVIDRENCQAIGAPDYFDVITTPMNLSYIQDKVNKMQYSTLQSFFSDVDLMINNAILYNSDPENPYRIAAEEMKRRHEKIVRKVWQQIQKSKQQS